jgi:hypothetical protein
VPVCSSKGAQDGGNVLTTLRMQLV